MLRDVLDAQMKRDMEVLRKCVEGAVLKALKQLPIPYTDDGAQQIADVVKVVWADTPDEVKEGLHRKYLEMVESGGLPAFERAVLGLTQGASLGGFLEDAAAKEVERVDPDHFDEVDLHDPEWYGLDQSDCF